MKLLGLFCPGCSLEEIEKTSNFDEKINKISNRIGFLSELVAFDISERMTKAKELKDRRHSALSGEAPIDWRNQMYCADRLLEARISEIKELRTLKREVMEAEKKKKETKKSE